jgi:TonB family protein
LIRSPTHSPSRALARCALAIAVAILGAPSLARGEPPAAENPRPTLTPPRLLSSPDVAYPASGHGDGVVELVLTVAVDGSVTDARAVRGDEPFASDAVAAARAWRFEPARRDGHPVASRIRFEVRYDEPAPVPAADAASPPEAAATASSPRRSGKAEPRIEVTVLGERAQLGGVSLGRAEVRQLPGAFGDPFRAIDSLPGVSPMVSGLPFFYVRGAPPGNVGYFLDGIRVPYLFHVGLGPSVIHPGLVDRVELYPGGYPAQYGRFTGGIVAAETTAPRAELHGEGNVRLFDAGALLETGLGDGRATALVAGRYSYTAAILSLILGDVTLDYRDFEARATYDLTPNDRITLFGFGAYDLLGQTTDGLFTTLFGSEFYRLDTRYDHRFDRDTTARVALTLGWDQTKIPGMPRNQQDTLVGGRIEASHAFSPQATLRGGCDVQLDAFRADTQPYADPEAPTTVWLNGLFPPRDDVVVGAWSDLVYKSDSVEITPGVRVDLFRSGSASAVGIDPRVASRIRLAPAVHVLHTLGLAHQPPSFFIPVPGLAIGNLRGGLQTSIQSSAGVELALPEATTATVTVFDNVFLNMSDTLGVQQGEGTFMKEQRSLGSAYGLEVYVRRRLTRRVGGFVSYTLSRSTRSVGAAHFPSAFDRTHVGNAAVAFDLGRHWRAGTRLTVYSGPPKQESNDGLIPPPQTADPPRDPTFYRIDFRVEKRWQLTETVWLAFVAEMMNATLHKEVVMGQEIGPVSIPSLGVEGGL